MTDTKAEIARFRAALKVIRDMGVLQQEVCRVCGGHGISGARNESCRRCKGDGVVYVHFIPRHVIDELGDEQEQVTLL